MTRRRSDKDLKSAPLWYKDAVIYELHVRAFCDSNGDGIGDFNGLISKLDYLENLGITAIWLLPFYPSPLRDDGYDIADYTDVNPVYGTLADFRRFMKEAHRRGLRVISELVINHTSCDHPWFQRAREAPPGSRYRDFYVWSDTPERYRDARIIFQDFETSNWAWDPVAKAYYWHRFYSHQPDLNFENPEVQRALFKVVDFWMDMGVDGMRLDAVPYLFEQEGTNCENLPRTHMFLKELRAYIDGRYANRMLLAEANQWPEDAATYFGNGDECHMNFHFPLMPRMFMGVHLEDRFPIVDILGQTPEISETCQWATFLRNHDELTLEMVTDEDRDYMWRVYAEDRQARINLGIRRRLAPLLRTRRKIELLNALLFSLPGTPVLYYGDEIGMGDNIYLGDRDSVRTPMQWSADRNAGFSRANPQKLYLPIIVDPEFHFEAINVETELGNPSSLLWWMKRLISLSNRHKAFGRGDFRLLHPDNKRVLAFIRSYENERILVVANLSHYCQHVELKLEGYKGLTPEELFGRIPFPAIKEQPYFLSLMPHAFFWFELTESSVSVEVRRAGEIPNLGAVERLADLLAGPQRWGLERILVSYMRRQRWFRSKVRRIKNARIIDEMIFREGSVVLVVGVDFYDGLEEIYLVPLALLKGEEAERIRKEHSESVVANVVLPKESAESGEGVVCDAVQSSSFTEELLAMMRARKSVRGSRGCLVVRARNHWQKRAQEDQNTPRVGAAEQTNTNILYGQDFILKLQRVVEVGVNTDVEIVRFLNERTSFDHVPELLGTLEYKSPNRESATVGALQAFIPNQGDAWRFTLDTLDRYYDRILAGHADQKPELPKGLWVEQASQTPPEVIGEALGHYVPLVRLLGKRTAELHAALSTERRDPAFVAEPFTELHQRSLYQSARSRWIATIDTLRGMLPGLSKENQERAQNFIKNSEVVKNRLRCITGRKIKAQRIRCHGDYHLGQVLYTGKDFVLIDFEGEPARPISERRFKRCPLRDVAGMLRSFHYAAVSALRHREESEIEMEKIASWSRAWVHWVSALYLGAYLDATKDMPVVPERKEDVEDLLQFYLLEKCIYELSYELNHRLDWVSIPLTGLEDLLEDRAAGQT